MGEYRGNRQASRPQGAVVVGVVVLGLAMFSAASQAAAFWRYGVALAVVLLAVASAVFGWAAGYTAHRNEDRVPWRAGR